LAEVNQMTEGGERLQRTLERVLADGVIGHLDPPSIGNLAHTLDEVLLAVQNHMLAAGLAGAFSLVRVARRPNHRCAKMSRPLA
jgi:hypothetical protein